MKIDDIKNKIDAYKNSDLALEQFLDSLKALSAAADNMVEKYAAGKDIVGADYTDADARRLNTLKDNWDTMKAQYANSLNRLAKVSGFKRTALETQIAATDVL